MPSKNESRKLVWVDGTLVKLLRETNDVTQSQLAEVAGVSERLLCKMEAGVIKVQRENWAAVARALDVAPEAIATDGPEGEIRTYGAGDRWDDLDLISRIDEAIHGRSTGPAADGRIRLSPRKLQEIFSAYRLADLQTYSLQARVVTHRGVGYVEANVLGGVNGIATRFLLVRQITPKARYTMTVYAPTEALTTQLFDAAGRSALVDITLRAHAVDYRPDGASVSGIAPTDAFVPPHIAREFKGFQWFGSTSYRPWVLVVEGVAPAPAEPKVTPVRKRARAR